MIEIKHKLEQELAELKEKDKQIDIISRVVEKDKEIERLQEELNENLLTTIDHESHFEIIHEYENEIKELENSQTQIAISELEKVNGILTDTIIEVTHNEFDLNKLCYLEEISASFYEKMQEQIKELKGE